MVSRWQDQNLNQILPNDPVRGFEIHDFLGLNEVCVARPPPVPRSRSETKEEKIARKQAVKADKQSRRVEKKSLKEAFIGERKSQIREQVGRQIGGVGLKKL